MIKIRRAYETPGEHDGERILVDKLWPRGIKKEDLDIKQWCKFLSPSTDLRKWFGHDPDKFAQFKEKYIKELKANDEAIEMLQKLAKKSQQHPVTLIYSAKDEAHNNAVVLANLMKTDYAGHIDTNIDFAKQ